MVSSRPVKEITPEDLTDQSIHVDYWDPRFWEKVTHVTCESYWEKEHVFCSHFEYYSKLPEVYGEMAGGCGYMYILTCPNQPGICKIGSTERTPEARLREINYATGVIIDWEVYSAFSCKAPKSIEAIVHKLLYEQRISRRKEGFAVSPEVAQKVVRRVISDCKAEIEHGEQSNG